MADDGTKDEGNDEVVQPLEDGESRREPEAEPTEDVLAADPESGGEDGHEEDGEPSEPSLDGQPIRRIARTFQKSGAVGAGAELTSTVLSSLREVALPLGTLVLLATILITFRQILLPFILACALVYLMEPIIRLLTRRPGRNGLPRWLSVVVVYISFIMLITTTIVFVVPPFVSEIVRFAEEAPEQVYEFRTERLPGLNQSAQEFMRNYLPVQHVMELGHHEIAQAAIAESRRVAAEQALAFGMAHELVHRAASPQFVWQPEAAADPTGATNYVLAPALYPALSFSLKDSLTTTTGWVYGEATQGLVIEPRSDGTWRVNLHDASLNVTKVGEDSWILRPQDVDVVPITRPPSSVDIEQMFDLEERLDDLIQNLVSTSNERLASVIEFAQRLVVGVVGMFVGILLTLMVAGFISIDLPRVMGFMRSLVPRRMRGGYEVLLEQLDTGLAGVVRGQLLICVVNGILTYIGLVLIGVKFQVLLAVIAGVLSLIPVFGTVLSTIPIVLFGLTQGLSTGVFALLWILGIHALEANLLNPKIIGSSAHIHPVIVIFALLAGESAYGLVGALLAVPTASILLTLFNFVRTRAWTRADAVEPSS